MSKDDADKIEEMNEIADIFELILYFNDEDQKGDSFEILTPNQIISRLPISSAQLKIGNNSEKLYNKIRQPLYSLCR